MMRKSEVDLDAIEREYIDGVSTYEIGARYGVDHATVSKWMKQRGHTRGRRSGAAIEASRKKQSEEAETRFVEMFASEYADEIEYVERIDGQTARFKCLTCGHEWVRNRRRDVLKAHIGCPACIERERAARHEKQKQERLAKAAAKAERDAALEPIRAAKAKEVQELRARQSAVKVCPICDERFTSTQTKAVYCSQRCNRIAQKRKSGHSCHRQRARKYGVEYDSSVTLRKLFKRDNGVCQICGKPCDWKDVSQDGYIGKNYPTIDHIVAMVNGGAHVWDNVQLACMYCNSVKGASV